MFRFFSSEYTDTFQTKQQLLLTETYLRFQSFKAFPELDKYKIKLFKIL